MAKKYGKEFKQRLSLMTTKDQRIKLIAVGYMAGDGGEYGAIARRFLHEGLMRYVAGLSPEQRKEFDEILESVTIRELGENEALPQQD